MSEDDEEPKSNETDLADDSLPPDIEQLFREDIIELMAGLSPRERDVLRLRFGLDDGHQRTLEEVGVLFGVTRERVRIIEASALRKLRRPGKQFATPRSRRTRHPDGADRKNRPSLRIVRPSDPLDE